MILPASDRQTSNLSPYFLCFEVWWNGKSQISPFGF